MHQLRFNRQDCVMLVCELYSVCVCLCVCVCVCVFAANPIGLAVAQLASPYIVTSTERIPMMVRNTHNTRAVFE